MASNLVKIAQNSTNINVTLKNAAEAMTELNIATGFVANYSADALETQVMLTKQFGLTADEAAGIYKFSVLTGKASSEINDNMVGAFVAARNQLGVGVPFKATIAEAAKVSGQLAANLKNNPESIVKAVVQAKALGTTLEQTKAQSESLLDFESSIGNQLKAELLTGQQLNLERARAAALVGDQVTVAKELTNQGITLEKFSSMNVLQQKSLAQALGLNSDQLADQLTKQKLAEESGKSLTEITKEQALEAEKRQNIQDKFTAAMEKLMDVVGNLAAGPFGQLLETVMKIADVILKVVQPFVSVAGAILNPILGGISSLLSFGTADDMVGYGARTLVTPSGAVALNNNDTVIAGTNLFKGDDVMSFPKGRLGLGGGDTSGIIDALKEVKSAITNSNKQPGTVMLDGRNVGTALVQGTYKSA
jgi:hypothetical protein